MLGEWFWSKVDVADASACWLWSGALGRDGYGTVKVPNGKTARAHRLVGYVFCGLEEGQVCRHRCDNPRCVNPLHLLPGTHKDNSDDKVRRRRHCFGSARPAAKLNEEKVRDLRLGASAGESMSSLAYRYGVDRSVVSRVLSGKAWRHV